MTGILQFLGLLGQPNILARGDHRTILKKELREKQFEREKTFMEYLILNSSTLIRKCPAKNSRQ